MGESLFHRFLTDSADLVKKGVRTAWLYAGLSILGAAISFFIIVSLAFAFSSSALRRSAPC